MSITDAHADQIAALLNERNELTTNYTRKMVLKHADDYLWHLSESNEILACVEVKRVQWYQAEIRHLTVAAAREGKGLAKALLCEAERVARVRGARLLQCAMRRGNEPSLGLFRNFGFSHVNTFHNDHSGNDVLVLQKVLIGAAV